MENKKIIFESIIGSHLYGTNHEKSDQDFLGVYIPDLNEIIGMKNYPTEYSANVKVSTGSRNSSEDTDRKFFSLRQFFKLACEGQPAPVELLFSPKNMWIKDSEEWNEILENRHLFISKKLLNPFLGFINAQAHKAVIKGENYKKIQTLLEALGYASEEELNSPLSHIVTNKISESTKELIILGDASIDYIVNEHGFAQVRVAGRDFPINVKTRDFKKNLKALMERYGSRSQEASNHTYDYKSLMHAFRLIAEAKELMSEGKITLPRNKEEVEFYTKIRTKNWPSKEDDVFAEIQNGISEVKKLADTSQLQESPNYSKIEKLCIKLHRKYILG